MSGTTTVSVILPTYNRSAVVRETLRRLLAVEYPSDAFEVLVVDNSTDDTPEMVEDVAAAVRAPVRLVRSGERLPAVKRNQALRAASGDLAVFINDDLWVRSDFLREHERAHTERDEPVAVVGRVDQSELMPQTPFVEWYRPFAFDEIEERAGRAVPYRYFWSMNLSLPRATMLERNLIFHEDWREIGHEDVELGYRWAEAGLPIVYHPAAWGEHYHPHTLESACRLQASIGRGLRDLESLIPERDLLARYGVRSRPNPPVSLLRGTVREVLFNRVTVPPVQRWLSTRERNSALTRWLYWKVLLHHTNAAYRATPRRRPARTPTREVPSEARERIG